MHLSFFYLVWLFSYFRFTYWVSSGLKKECNHQHIEWTPLTCPSSWNRSALIHRRLTKERGLPRRVKLCSACSWANEFKELIPGCAPLQGFQCLPHIGRCCWRTFLSWTKSAWLCFVSSLGERQVLFFLLLHCWIRSVSRSLLVRLFLCSQVENLCFQASILSSVEWFVHQRKE